MAKGSKGKKDELNPGKVLKKLKGKIVLNPPQSARSGRCGGCDIVMTPRDLHPRF